MQRPFGFGHIWTYCHCSSSKILEKNSDLKEQQAFQEVISVLKACKDKVVQSIFRYGLILHLLYCLVFYCSRTLDLIHFLFVLSGLAPNYALCV